jgi:hypothetical protein
VFDAISDVHLTTAVSASCDRVITFLVVHFSEFQTSDHDRQPSNRDAMSFDELVLVRRRFDLKLHCEEDLCEFLLSCSKQDLTSCSSVCLNMSGSQLFAALFAGGFGVRLPSV